MHGRLLRRLRTGGVRGQAIDEPERAVAELAGAAAALLARRGDDVQALLARVLSPGRRAWLDAGGCRRSRTPSSTT